MTDVSNAAKHIFDYTRANVASPKVKEQTVASLYFRGPPSRDGHHQAYEAGHVLMAPAKKATLSLLFDQIPCHFSVAEAYDNQVIRLSLLTLVDYDVSVTSTAPIDANDVDQRLLDYCEGLTKEIDYMHYAMRPDEIKAIVEDTQRHEEQRIMHHRQQMMENQAAAMQLMKNQAYGSASSAQANSISQLGPGASQQYRDVVRQMELSGIPDMYRRSAEANAQMMRNSQTAIESSLEAMEEAKFKPVARWPRWGAGASSIKGWFGGKE